MNGVDTPPGRPRLPGHVLVVGAGLAAVTLCGALREGGFPGRLTIVGDEPRLPYDRPPLSKQYLAGERELADIALQLPDWYHTHAIDLRLGTPVVMLDPAAGRVELADGKALAADAIVLATGGRARRLTVPGCESARALRTRADAQVLRDALAPGAHVLVVGAGLIGAEVAATASGRGCHVVLVDPNALPLQQAIGPPAARALHAQHAAHGVHVVCGSVVAVESGRAVLTTGEHVPADVIVAGIGITVNTELAQAAGLEVDNGVLVDAGMRTSAANVYAIGDVARIASAPHRSEHWDNARRTAQAAARSLLGLPPQNPPAPWFWTDRYGTHFEMAGHYHPRARPVQRGDIETGQGTVFYLRGSRCVGAVSLDRPLDVRAAQRLIDRNVDVEAAQLADEDVDLRKLLKPRA
ncbi:hypothetical protein BIV57_10960 [Mangrovactinospora gilvigrisea]|uniref:Ferredoxin reductase n=1 Tax=Mangrovactinospora gilvigrisea TaxID=1428644 RepID=A0A1J7C7F5_9ACTN|nr:FAD-dependent oxidoreductase [Mangrovactinospora gilvigrisea]OIV37480.1 hypothetical protein BIV57_10960 [Mangrovactinospora gilvigrisea]